MNNLKTNNILSHLFLGLGTNLGNKKENIEIALEKIEMQIGTIVSLSAFFVSEPLGFKSDNLFLNCAVEVETTFSPLEVLNKTQLIEKEMGRLQKSMSNNYSDRIIDIDILFYNNIIYNDSPTLIIPHPHIQKRLFVLKPLSEIAPNYVHPVLNKTVLQLLKHSLK